MSVATSNPVLICYEQPLNEPIRICLRIETLFTELRHHLSAETDHSFDALITLLKIINVVDRPDIKSKITQTLNQYALSLSQLKQFDAVDRGRLDTVLGQLDTLAQGLHNNKQKIADRLKSNHFLNQLRLQVSNPAGVCSYASAALSLWQHQSLSTKLEHLHHWASMLNDIDTSAELILGLIRQSTNTEPMLAKNGFYQQTLNPSLPCELIHIKVASDLNLYPEISAGRHRLTIRFMQPNFYLDGHAQQSTENIAFELGCCRL